LKLKYTPIEHYHRNLVISFLIGLVVGVVIVFAYILSI